MRWLLVLSLLGQVRAGHDERDVRAGGRPQAYRAPIATAPQFEFAPTSGAGMTAACACATVTGSLGETVTFTRASDGWCTKGNETTGIANGDLVKCTTDAPRVMPGGNGAGIVGLLMEPAATNSTIRSQEFDDSAWLSFTLVSPAPVITADDAVAPDGTTTADRIVFGVVTGVGERSSLRQLNACPNGAASAGLYVKEKSGGSCPGGVDIATDDGAAFVYSNTAVGSTWTRAKLEGATSGDATHILYFGNTGHGYAGAPMATCDLLAWQMGCQAGARLTSPIATAGTSATRAKDVASVSYTAAGGTQSMAATVIPHSFEANAYALTPQYTDSSNFTQFSTGVLQVVAVNYKVGGSAHSKVGTATLTLNAENRMAGYYDGVNVAACLAGVCETAATSVTLQTGAITTYLGLAGSSTASQLNGVLKKVCIDPSASKCI